MRKRIVAANWKMNLSYAEAMSLTDALVDATNDINSFEIILSAPFIYLHELIGRIISQPFYSVAAQNCSSEEKGPFTGEISAIMLASIGVDHILIGHSERRTIFKEDDALLAKKVSKTLAAGIHPIYCCGENSEQRKANQHFSTIDDQLNRGLFHVSVELITECIIAYEPVWAIGTGLNASPAEAQEMHSFIRNKLKDKYGDEVAGNVTILYGGSVSKKNADEIFSCSDVDGGLVGGASLNSAEFLSIIRSMKNILGK